MLLAWLFSNIARHKERVMLIEKGINPDEYAKEKEPVSLGIKVGIVILGLSLGLAIISIMVSLKVLPHSDAGPLAILGICVGSSLVLANYMGNKKS